MKLPLRSLLSRIFKQPNSPSRRPQFRPAVECLEDRTVLTTVFLVPITQPLDATHRYSLPDALTLAGAGGIVIIEPGTAPQSGTVINITLADITIQGDPAVAAGSLQSYDLNISASPVTLTNLNLGNVTVAATAHDVTITRSHLVNFTETGAVSGAGNNTLRHNLITGSVDLGGNSGLLQLTGDSVEENDFVGSAPIQLKLTNSNLTTVQGNHFINNSPSGTGIQVRSNSDGVTIAENTVEMTGAGAPLALVLVNTGGAAGNILGVKVLNNVLSTNGNGTGLLCNVFGTGAFFVAQVEGNELNGNNVGIDIIGITGQATGAGNIDIGGGSNSFGASKGANNFRGFDGVSGHFAIVLRNTDAGVAVSAQQNIFDNGINVGTVVKDGANGGGTGVLNVSNTLDPNHAYVQSLFTQVLGRAGDPAAGGEVDQLVAKLATKGNRGVAKAILLSNESLGRMVNNVFSEYLDRDALPAELTKFAKLLKAGKDITAVEARVLGSIEYQGRIDTNFVQGLYQDLLHRSATSAEVAKSYKTLQVSGLKGVAASIALSKERRLDAATDYYRDFLHRDPTPTEATALATRPGGLLSKELQILGRDDFFNHG